MGKRNGKDWGITILCRTVWEIISNKVTFEQITEREGGISLENKGLRKV